MMKKISPCCTILCGVTAIGLFIFSFLAGSIMNKSIFKQAAQNVALKPSTYEKWGSVPGSTGTFVYKNYTFFNFSNPADFAYFNQTAKVIETRSIDYQEYQNLLDPNYTNNSAGVPVEVSFYHQRYNLPLNTTVDYENRTVLNLGPMGVWTTAKALGYEIVGMGAFSVLQKGFVKNLYPSVLAKGIRNLNMKDQDSCNSQILDKVIPELTQDQKNAIWADPVYGMNSSDSFALWMAAATDGYLSGAANILKDYFQISTAQISSILGKPLKDWIVNLNGVVASWYNCSSNPCDPTYLGALQWTQQGVSSNPPKTSNSSGPDPFPSIASVNKTVSGYPELSYYMNEYLFKNNFTGNMSEYENLVFSVDFGLQVLNGTPTLPYSFPATNQTLLNIKNYDFIFKVGQGFEINEGSPNKLDDLRPIQERWNLSSLQHAYVFYSYCKYFVHEFALKESMNGTRGYLALGKLGSQTLFEKFNQLKNFLYLDMVSRDISKNILHDNLTCPVLFNISLEGVDDTQLQQICSIPQLASFDYNSIKFLVSICRYEQQYAYQVLINTTNLTARDVMTLCQNMDVQTFATYYDSSEAMLNAHYGCKNMSNSCSDLEFATMQWGSSNITKNLPLSLQSQFLVNSTNSVADLYPQVFRKPIEYFAVISYLSPNYPDLPLQALLYEDTLMYLTSLSLLSPAMIQRAFLLNITQDFTNFTRNFGFDNPIPLLSYIRYLIIEHAFDGLSQTRTSYDLLYGYKDRLLDKVSKMNVVEGGNPSINSIIAVGGQNSSVEDARKYFQTTLYTGGDDPAKVKRYKETQNTPFINYNCSYFDGMEVKLENKSPWKTEVPITGTDTSLNSPNFTEGSNFTVFVTDMYFIGWNIIQNITKKEIKGLTTYRLGIENITLANKTNNPANDKYFSDKYNTAINLTKARVVPAYITKQYLLDADWSMVSAVEMYRDANMTNRIWPSRDYDLNIYVEPTTGAALKAEQRLQLNLLFEPDELFPNVKNSFVPLMYFYRGFEFSDKTINDVFKPLKIGFFIRDNSIYILMGFSLLALLLTICCGCIWSKRAPVEESDDYIETNDPDALLITNKRRKSESITQI